MSVGGSGVGRRGRAMRALTHGVLLGLVAALLRVDFRRSALAEKFPNGNPNPMMKREMSDGIRASLDEEARVIFARTHAGVHDKEDDGDVIIVGAKDETITATTPMADVASVGASDSSDVLARNPVRENPRRVAPLDPFTVRAIDGARPDAFSPDDARENMCEPKSVDAKVWGSPRALDYIVSPSDPVWPQNCENRTDLCDVLRRVAVNREVLAAVANSQAPGLDEFLRMLKALNIPNFMVIALDVPLSVKLTSLGVPYYLKIDDVQGNHKVSAKKFALIEEFVAVGCSVLLTDTDVAYQQNPFPYLYRDSDIESMSDGFDNDSANGFLQTIDDASMGPARKRAGSFRAAALNSGMWYVGATRASERLMKIMAHRMATEDLWDQSGYNLELWFASRDDHMTSGATVRVLHPFCFLNSKVMFRIVRHEPRLRRERHRPVAMHANYHTDKSNKIKLVHEYYTKNAPLASLECVIGCEKGVKSMVALEAEHLHSINDGVVGSKTWKVATIGAKTCAPMTAWKGAITGLERELHMVDDTKLACAKAILDATAKRICDTLGGMMLDVKDDVVVIVASANESDLVRMLLERGINAHGLTNRTLVVTNDEDVASLAAAAGVAAVRPSSTTPTLSSVALKWYTIHTILLNGRGVVYVDPAVVLLDDPSKYFYGDSDLESASDGWDDVTAYGYDHVVDDPSMDWSRFLHGGRVASVDAGFFRLAPTYESVALAERVATRTTALGADVSTIQEQDAFNAAVFYPSYGETVAVGVTRRTLNYLCFANSKTVFVFMRKDKTPRHSPVMIHFSYHPGELERMRDAYAYYGAGEDSSTVTEAFMKWSGGPGLAKAGDDTSGACAAETHASAMSSSDVENHAFAKSLVAGGDWSWAGATPMKFLDQGALDTPWGKGKWSLVKDSHGSGVLPTAVWADFGGAHHLLKFETPEGEGAAANSMFVSERCADGNLVVGRRVPKKRE